MSVWKGMTVDRGNFEFWARENQMILSGILGCSKIRRMVRVRWSVSIREFCEFLSRRKLRFFLFRVMHTYREILRLIFVWELLSKKILYLSISSLFLSFASLFCVRIGLEVRKFYIFLFRVIHRCNSANQFYVRVGLEKNLISTYSESYVAEILRVNLT